MTHAPKVPAVFFDRDGVLNVDSGYVHRADQFEWIEGAMDAIALLKTRGYFVAVVTNQSGVARGYYDEPSVNVLHQHMQTELQLRARCSIDAFYYCPHLPDAALPQYRQHCACRKPNPGMLLTAAGEHGLDLARSYMVGDRDTDMAAASAAGVRGLLYVGGSVRDLVALLPSV